MSDESGLDARYDPAAIERQVYARWEQAGCFASQPRTGREAFCILLPPPNVTGSLHMGHAFQHAVMDALSRHQRMAGRNVLWQPGTDHAGVGTHIIVSRALRQQGTDPASLSREEFLAKVRDWKEESASTIGTQMRRLGASCDWDRDCFTLDAGPSAVVRDVFVRLYQEGLIYRGKRLVNWDPKLLTALADLETSKEEEEGVMYHVRYPFADRDDGSGVVIATTRPETILVDGAVAVAPGDERFRPLLGRMVRVPCTDRTIPVIADEHVDASFGSGCVKITPAHDFNDYQVAQRHPEIPVIELMTPAAALNDNAPPAYRGLDRYAARERIVADLDAAGLLVKREPHRYKLPRGERSGAVVEPMLSDQWFLRAAPLAERALRARREGRLRFVPNQWDGVYDRWLEDIEDWCVSRQIDWGHPIPAWQDEAGECFVAACAADAQAAAGDDRTLRPVTDVLDTWFSSALWPLSTLGWPDTANPHFQAYFPTSVLVTGNDIIFFWVARMVMMAEHLVGETPFRQVYMHGLVRDRNGDKMSKSRGNVIDPIDLVDGISLEALLAKRAAADLSPEQAQAIAQRTRAEFADGIPAFGADALRLSFASLASHGRDINFDIQRIDGHRRLCNKLWQAARFILGHCADGVPAGGDAGAASFGDRWMRARLDAAAAEAQRHFEGFRLDLLVETLTALLRDDFCDWYIEIAKHSLADPASRDACLRTLVDGFGTILRLAHPVIPFITAELWTRFQPLLDPDMPAELMVAPYPVPAADAADAEAVAAMERFQELVRGCRSLRAALGFDPGKRIPGRIAAADDILSANLTLLARLGRFEKLEAIAEMDASEPVVAAGSTRLQLRLGEAGRGWQEVLRDKADQLERDADRLRQRLELPDFVANAPAAVVEAQRARLAGVEERLAAVRALLPAA